MASRKLSDLTSVTEGKARFVKALCGDRGIDLLIYCTHRTIEEQAVLYRKGRTRSAIERKAEELSNLYDRPDLSIVLETARPQYGFSIVTYAAPGQSMHNYRLAFDAVPVVDGKLQWGVDSAEWEIYGASCAEADLEWAGTWSTGRREYPHAQEEGLSWKILIGDYDYDRKA